MPHDPMQDIRTTYFLECAELMEDLVDRLDTFCAGQTDAETVNTIFRAVHSIKGGAGAFGFDALVLFAHGFENVLDAVRSRQFTPNSDECRVFLQAADVLGDLIQSAELGTPANSGDVGALLSKLDAFVAPTADATLAFTPQPLSFALPDSIEPCAKDTLQAQMDAHELDVTFTPSAALYQNGNDPMPALSQLNSDEVRTLKCKTDSIPMLEDMTVEESYLEWGFRTLPGVCRADIESVFQFMEGLCCLTISPVDVTPENPDVETIGTPMSSDQDSAPGPLRTLHSNTVRVDLDRIDRLVNLVGELVINQSMLSQHLSETSVMQAPEVASGLDDFLQLTRDIQDSVMTIRAQPVKSLFQRLARTVREVARKTEKEVDFITRGETTEIDKTVLEQLAEPLTHMIRNAFDHGLEVPELRVASGKPPKGRVTLSAEHKSGRVVLEMHDDGVGLDRARITAKAVSRGLIKADAVMSDAEINALLFKPGFSTASQVTDLSGRGVGMDVVKRAIQGLGGRVRISSDPGNGTLISISLPLTLAIMDGMIVKVAGEVLVLPLAVVHETCRIEDGCIDRLDPDTIVFILRGEVFPLYDLGTMLGLRPDGVARPAGIAMLISTERDQRIAVRVDAIEDQRQVVIKGLPGAVQHPAGVSAATILGNGNVSFIIDPSALVPNAISELESAA